MTCAFCSRASVALCDHPIDGGTCDAAMCPRHRYIARERFICTDFRQGGHSTTDYCPKHRPPPPPVASQPIRRTPPLQPDVLVDLRGVAWAAVGWAIVVAFGLAFLVALNAVLSCDL